ncbi:hypothetical protein Dimus_012946 [Dionaea muscipula]
MVVVKVVMEGVSAVGDELLGWWKFGLGSENDTELSDVMGWVAVEAGSDEGCLSFTPGTADGSSDDVSHKASSSNASKLATEFK